MLYLLVDDTKTSENINYAVSGEAKRSVDEGSTTRHQTEGISSYSAFNPMVTVPPSNSLETDSQISLSKEQLSSASTGKGYFKDLLSRKLGLSRDTGQTLLDRDKYITRFSTFLLIFTAYGLIFPPLAMIAWSSILLRLLFEEIVMGRILYHDGDNEKLVSSLEERVSKNCEGMNQYMRYGIVSILPISLILFGFLTIDIFGSSVEIAVAGIPSLMYLLLSVMSMLILLYRKEGGNGSEERVEREKELELKQIYI